MRPIEVMAFYYPYYVPKGDPRPQRWSDCHAWDWIPLKDKPKLGWYDSSDPEIVREHIRMAKSAGIDGFIVSWWGMNGFTDLLMPMILDEAAKQDFKISIYFETLGIDLRSGGSKEKGIHAKLDPTKIKAQLEYAIEYTEHPAFWRRGGNPVIPIYASTVVPLALWNRVLSDPIFNEILFLACSFDRRHLRVFDGLHQYSMVGCKDPRRMIKRAPRWWIAPRKKAYVFDILGIPVSPGYDDTLIPGRQNPFVVERKDGSYYRQAWDLVLKAKPDVAFITTFNEWWEHSYIEPSERYGDLYLQITAEYAKKFKGA